MKQSPLGCAARRLGRPDRLLASLTLPVGSRSFQAMATDRGAALDDELVARAMRWCGEAGRPCSASALRSALAPLSWDELLAARAILADPPTARPLGPLALADLARGTSPAEAASRQREGLYGAGPGVEATVPESDVSLPERTRPAASPRGARRPRGAAAPVVRRARDRAPAGPPPAKAAPRLDSLFAPAGRAVVERLLRERGARRAELLAALRQDYTLGDGGAPGDPDLDALLDAHGLARAFARHERDELVHALRVAGGSRAAAAAALGLGAEAFEIALARLGATAEAEAVRDGHREELRRRATLGERARLLLTEGERLTDLGLAGELEDDLRTRLPGHVRALRSSSRRPAMANLALSLSVGHRELAALVRRLGLSLGLDESRRPPDARRTAPRGAPPGRERPGRDAARMSPPRREKAPRGR